MSKKLGKEISLNSVKKLHDWYQRQKRVLAWRTKPSPYQTWVSEVMLQQTRVETVKAYFLRWMNRFPTVESLANSEESDVLEMWQGLGYYRRARFLRAGAKYVVENYGPKKFPKTREEWRKVPGVGEYTSGAICSIALELPEEIVDGNVERVFSRFFQKKDLKSIREDSKFYVDLGSKNGMKPSNLNQALMELGALVCTPKSPKCEECPLQEKCLSFQNQKVHLYPPKKDRGTKKLVNEYALCLIFRDRVYLHQNVNTKWRAGLWDFPNFKSHEEMKKMISNLKIKPIDQVQKKQVYVVTNHKIEREIFYVWVSKKIEKNLQSFPVSELPPLGAPTKKALQYVLK